MSNKLISICIPAYKRSLYLERLLESIAIQTFRDFDVIVTDDSPDDEVEQLCKQYESKFNIQYNKNKKVLGSPENWNEGIRKATGEWIKLMHDDDWFSDSSSLGKFAQRIKEDCTFIFSGYNNIYLDADNRIATFIISKAQKKLLDKDPYNLLRKNYIGHPSTTLIKNNLDDWYDAGFQWVVDIEFYIRYLLHQNRYAIIEEPIINIGMSSTQVTATVFRNPAVEIPENIRFLKKMKKGVLNNIFVYDYFWRLIRNLSISNEAMITEHYSGVIPQVIKKIIAHQQFFSSGILKVGVISKALMFFSYLMNRRKGNL